VRESAFLERLRASKAFEEGRSAVEKKKFRELIAPRIALLADSGGVLSADVFARGVGVLPGSIRGVVLEMQEWINFDGYGMVEHDPLSKRVLLRLDLIEAYLREYG
jgi:hypothetical protein